MTCRCSSRGETGGRYWFSHGWNWRGLGAWIPSALVGLCFVNLPVTLGLASVVYLTLLRLFLEPASVYEPTDPRSKSKDSLAKPAMQQQAA